MDHFKICYNIASILYFRVSFSKPQAMWDQTPARDQTHTACIRRQSLNRWTTREVPLTFDLFSFLSLSLEITVGYETLNISRKRN